MKKYRNKADGSIGILVHDDITKTIKYNGKEEIFSNYSIRQYWDELITYEEMCEKMSKYNKEHDETVASLSAIIVFANESFVDDYSETSRSYRVWNNSGMFQKKKSSELIGECLDGSETTPLDEYLRDCEIDYCYFEVKFDD